MQAKNIPANSKWKTLLWALPALALFFWQRALILRLASQLVMGVFTAMAALPLCRPLEKRMKGGKAAALAILGLILLMISLLMLLIPFLITQAKQIGSLLPGALERLGDLIRNMESWLAAKGIHLEESWKSGLLSRGEMLLNNAAKLMGSFVQSLAGSLGRWMLTPVFAFYLLRDRQEISQWALMLFPVSARGFVVRVLREMRRETFGYLRAQLMISAVIGTLTALGLLLCGIPAWLFLGFAMAVLELIPYLGPLLGGGLVLLFSWQKELSRMLWALALVIAVQQVEGNLLSPKLTSQATRLHPLAVLLGTLAGGSIAGMTGILLAVPVILCIRALIQVIEKGRMNRQLASAEEIAKQKNSGIHPGGERSRNNDSF